MKAAAIYVTRWNPRRRRGHRHGGHARLQSPIQVHRQDPKGDDRP